jgi:S-DNA-T family DNA segregation ATPase FtsK/SpoIIIE
MKSLLRLFTPTKNRRFNELIGFTLIAAALLLFLALASYSPLDPSLNTATSANASTQNWIGPVGAVLSDALLQLFGIAIFTVPVMLFVLGLRWFRSRPTNAAIEKLLGSVVLLLFIPAVMGLVP